MNSVYIALAALAGVLLPLQAGFNAALSKFSGSGLWAALISFVIGTGVLALLVMTGRNSLQTETLLKAPAWVWLGGLTGAIYVYVVIVSAPKLGAATLIGVTIAGQLIASLVIDHYGWVGFSQQSISLPRLLGAGMLIAGVILIKKY